MKQFHEWAIDKYESWGIEAYNMSGESEDGERCHPC